jgi:exopolysaccharide biosynthesis polyprenyl glycosylphosphotransferase
MNMCLGLCDLVVISGAWMASYLIRFDMLHAQKGLAPWQAVAINLLLTLLLSLVVMAGSGLYRPRRDKSFLFELGHIIKASILIWGVLIIVLYFTHEEPFTRGMLAIFLPIMTGSLIVERGLFRASLRYIRRRGWNLRHAVIVGTGRLAQSTLQKIESNSWTGIRIRGFVDTHATTRKKEVRGVKVLGNIENLSALVQAQGIDCVFVAIAAKHGEQLQHVIRELEQTSVDVRIIPDLYMSRFPMNVAVSELDGLPVLSLRENPLAGWPGIYKRSFDIAGAGFGLVVFGIPMLLIAAIIKLTSRGPVIYRQQRVSFGGKPFDMFKFRTMTTDAEAAGPVFTERGDPRCTTIGRWLRSASLDELPQLLNVIKGDMSLVGPRPERPEMLSKIQQEIPTFPLRLKVRAGLTGWAQINGFRGRTSFRKRLQYDLYYLNNWSPLLDLRIVLATFFRGFKHPNAY